MIDDFFSSPILNSPYEYPARHWELDPQGQPTQRILTARRAAAFFTPIPPPSRTKAKRKAALWAAEDDAGDWFVRDLRLLAKEPAAVPGGNGDVLDERRAEIEVARLAWGTVEALRRTRRSP